MTSIATTALTEALAGGSTINIGPIVSTMQAAGGAALGATSIAVNTEVGDTIVAGSVVSAGSTAGDYARHAPRL